MEYWDDEKGKFIKVELTDEIFKRLTDGWDEIPCGEFKQTESREMNVLLSIIYYLKKHHDWGAWDEYAEKKEDREWGLTDIITKAVDIITRNISKK